MDYGVVEYIQIGFFACLFAISLTFLITNMNSQMNLIAETKTINESSGNVFYEHDVSDALTNDHISRDELISRMMHPLEYPVSIDGLTFLPENYHYINFDYSSIAEGEYRVTPVYDTSGKISMIRYDKI